MKIKISIKFSLSMFFILMSSMLSAQYKLISGSFSNGNFYATNDSIKIQGNVGIFVSGSGENEQFFQSAGFWSTNIQLLTFIADPLEEILPERYGLFQNYPNPFNPGTNIRFQLPFAGRVNISIFNVQGQLVKVLLDEFRQAGDFTIHWRGTNEIGEKVASGIYIYVMKGYQSNSLTFTQSKMMVFLK